MLRLQSSSFVQDYCRSTDVLQGDGVAGFLGIPEENALMSALVNLLIVSLLMVVAGADTGQPIDKRFEESVQVSVDSHQRDWIDSDSVKDAQRLSPEDDIPILLHFDASWCGACRRMEKQVFYDTAVKASLAKRLIGVRVDADRHRDLIRRYRISTLPTEIVITPDGTFEICRCCVTSGLRVSAGIDYWPGQVS